MSRVDDKMSEALGISARLGNRAPGDGTTQPDGMVFVVSPGAEHHRRQADDEMRPPFRGAVLSASAGRALSSAPTSAERAPSASGSSRPSARFLSLDEAALFDERAAIREHLGGLSRAAAERLAWLDVLMARQVAAGALDALKEAS